ncbi:MAG: hypothetical protein IJ829_06655, partial [Kiritimatiellae bacterium]|nr:hypothetical protein [Kiritimatiellia bacterium]
GGTTTIRGINGGYPGAAGGPGAGAGAPCSTAYVTDYAPDVNVPGDALDGRGGGGGGGGNQNQRGGNGGSGCVIVRYTDFSLAGDAPLLTVHGDEATTGQNVIDIPVDVTYAGTGASTVTLTASWGYSSDDLTVGSTVIPDFVGAVEISATGLLPGTEYFFSVVADNGEADGTTDSGVLSFTTAPMFSAALSLAATGGVLGYTIDGAASADSQRLELWVGADAASRTLLATYADASLMTAGSHTLQPFVAEQFGETLSILLRHIAVVGDLAFTNDTAALSTTLTDGATYTWKSDAHEGDWCDADNWTASTTPGRGFPVAGSTAKFPNAVVTCRVDRAVVASTITYTASGSTTFLGTTAAAAISLGAQMDLPQSGTVVFDGISLTSTANIKFNNGTMLRFLNGTAATVSKFDAGSLSAWATFEVNASTMTASFETRNLEMILESATVNSTGIINLLNNNSNNGTKIRFKDASSRIVTANTIYSGGTPDASHTKAAVVLDLANGTYSSSEALVKMSNKSGRQLCNSGGPVVFSAPTTAGSRRLGKCEVFVADWTDQSINASLVEFGEVDREGSYFYFTETADPKGTQYKSAAEVSVASATVKCLWYHHASAPGLAIVVR